MKKSIFYSLSLLIGLILFFIALKEIGLENLISALGEVSLIQFLIALGAMFLAFLIGTLRWKIIIDSQLDKPLCFKDVFIPRVVGFSINYLTPVVFAGGQPVKAYIVKERNKCSLEKVIISIILEEAIFLSILFVFVILGVIFLFTSFNLPSLLKNIVFLITFFCSIIFFLFYYRILRKKPDRRGFFTFFIEMLRLDKISAINNIKEKVADIEKEIFYFFKKQRKKLILVSFLTVIEILFLILAYYLIISYLSPGLNLIEVFSINSLINIVYFIPIPAALGSFEWSQALIFNVFGLSLNTGIAFSLIVRILNLILVSIGILLLVHFEVKTLAEKIGEGIKKLIDIFE